MSNNCPACNSEKIEYFSNQYKKVRDKKNYVSNEKLYQCSECASIYVLPIMDDKFTEDGNRYYDQLRSSQDDISGMMSHVELIQKPKYDYIKKNILDKRFSMCNTWLDIGSCGYATTFQDYDITTIEPDISMVSLGRKLFNEANIECSDLLNYETRKKFDALLFNHSFYCVANPTLSIQKIDKILNPNGIVLIGIGHIFMEAFFTADSNIEAIEDILVGETMKVYYSQESLEYLMHRHSYELIDNFIAQHDIPAKGSQTRYLAFKKVNKNNLKNKEYLKKNSYDKIHNILNQYKKSFFQNSVKTFEKFNTKDTVIIGDESLFYEVHNKFSLAQVYGFIPYNVDIDGIYIDNINILNRAYINNENIENILILDFENSKSIIKFLRSELKRTKNIYIFNRTSSINSLYFKIKNKDFIANAFNYTLLDEKLS